MKGDFSRLTFDPEKHYSRVLMQQGRVQVDADWNEQVAILLYRLETMTADLIGPFGGPEVGCGFEIKSSSKGDFQIGGGRYYVGGLLCENHGTTTYLDQPFAPSEKEKAKPGDDHFLIYLDAWEQDVNAIEEPSIREPALGGADTAGRSRVVWRVRTMSFEGTPAQKDKDRNPEFIVEFWSGFTDSLQPPHRGRLSVRIGDGESTHSGPCIVPPSARYRGAENQLYRVEIHNGGKAGNATFKWSRENGCATFPIASGGKNQITLKELSADRTLGLRVDDWVELIDDDYGSSEEPRQLLQVDTNPVDSRITLRGKGPFHDINTGKHPYLRRWDQKGPDLSGGAVIEEGIALQLEDGIQINFAAAESDEANMYRSGDYWCFPLRTGDLDGGLTPVEPHGTNHRYAPLAIARNGKFTSCRKFINSNTVFEKDVRV
jgi:hypothetical protein